MVVGPTKAANPSHGFMQFLSSGLAWGRLQISEEKGTTGLGRYSDTRDSFLDASCDSISSDVIQATPSDPGFPSHHRPLFLLSVVLYLYGTYFSSGQLSIFGNFRPALIFRRNSPPVGTFSG
ncbi:hypothetical protein ACH5RR_006252 [Cinchona calisaya]|uniref:Uncharacterized protein n=1 Tax=Cinchona calisaya TaxID=153742 RepID=A0ABD3ANT4_9GENT